jgi:hypothetical protein
MNTALRCATSAAAGNGLGTHGQVPAAHNDRRRGQRPGAAIKFLQCTTSGAAGNGLGTKFLRAAAGIRLGTTIKYLRGAADI